MTDYALWLAPAIIIIVVALVALVVWLEPKEDPNRWPGID